MMSFLLLSELDATDDINFLMTHSAPYGKPEFLGSEGVARLKLKEINRRILSGWSSVALLQLIIFFWKREANF